MAINFTRGGGFGGFTTLGQGGQSSPNNDDGAQRQLLRRTPLRPNLPVFFNPGEQGQSGTVFFNPAQTKSTYTAVKRQDAINRDLDLSGGRPWTPFTPSASPTPVPNAGLFHTPVPLPSNPGPPDAGGALGNLDDDIPPADMYDPSGPDIYWRPRQPPGAVVQVNPNGGQSPFGAGIVPGMYGDLWAGDANQYGNIFEGYLGGHPVFTAQTLSGAYPSSVSNPSGIASNRISGGGNTGGAGQTYSDGPSGFARLFGQPIGTPAPGGISEGQFAAWISGGGGSGSLAQFLNPPRQA